MPFYDIFCFLNKKQKHLVKKNPHTLHFFCYFDNIKILNNSQEKDYSEGYKYKRHITNKIPDSFNIDYDLVKNIYFQNTIKLTLDNNFPKLNYQDRRHRPTTTLHVGQIKLFATTLQFLTNYIPKNKETHILYPGSASGQNIHLLSKLFPNCFWYLIDPNPFYKKLYNNKNVLHIENKYFTDEDAIYFKEKLKNKFTVFISDIRISDIEDIREKREYRALDDQTNQYNWTKIFNADIHFLKFKIPRIKNKYKYFDGKLYLQPFAPVTSTETRLVVKKNPKDKIYDLSDYEDKFYYHNRILRVCDYSKLHNYKYKYFCNCYDCTLFFIILEEYINKFNPDLSIYTFIKKIFKYLENYDKFKEHYDFILQNIK
jgi:hypothetical protein